MLQVEILAEALNLGERSGVPRAGVVAIVEQLFPGAIIPGAAPQPAPNLLPGPGAVHEHGLTGRKSSPVC